MPSLALAVPILSDTPKDKKEKKNKKMKSAETVNATLETGSPISDKKKKKRKSLEIEEAEERSETSSELFDPVNGKADESKKKKKQKKAKVEEEDEGSPNAVSKFRISEPLKAKLKENGIESLFPIQALTFDTILDGSDLVGRARTGQVCSLRKFYYLFEYLYLSCTLAFQSVILAQVELHVALFLIGKKLIIHGVI